MQQLKIREIKFQQSNAHWGKVQNIIPMKYKALTVTLLHSFTYLLVRSFLQNRPELLCGF